MRDGGVCVFEKFLGQKGIPPKVIFMLWENFHNSPPILSMLNHGGIHIQSEICGLCKKEVEAHKIWSHFIKELKMEWVQSATVLQHFQTSHGLGLKGICKEVSKKLKYAIF